jgi:dephospho-CoA kinase
VLRVGLTGGLGAGKSTVGTALAARGALVIDADRVARDVIAPGSAGELAVLGHFGDRARRAGGLDRKALAEIVFSDATERLALESITHPLIRQEIARRVAQAQEAMIVVEIPLLVDRSRRPDYGLDVVVLVEAPEEVALRRAIGRGMTDDDARSRLAVQPSNAERRLGADRVLVNNGTLDDLQRAVDELWSWLVTVERRP